MEMKKMAEEIEDLEMPEVLPENEEQGEIE